MGLLRFILALTVVVAHSQPLFGFIFVGGKIAVQTFYMISGFYMALILNEKYVGSGSYKIFITNRFLRVFPTYWVVLVLTISMALIFYVVLGEGFRVDSYCKYISLVNIKSLLYITFTNVFIFGQDVVMFLKFGGIDGTLEFTANFNEVDHHYPPVFNLLFVPQGWTLALELMFYLIAPFIVRKGIFKILLVIMASLILRFYIYSAGFDYDPWTYRFFPVELTFFLSGSIAYKIYGWYKNASLQKWIYPFIFHFIITFTIFYQFVLLPHKEMLYFIVLLPAIPAIFIYTQRASIDNYLGELSYPIYICHIFILNMTTYKLFEGENKTKFYLLSICLTVLFSMLLVHLLIRPIEKFRQGRVRALT